MYGTPPIERQKEKRPKYNPLSTEEITKKINRETRLAAHSIRIYLIKNSPWILPLCFVVLGCIIIDFCIVLFYWKNPAILFNQIKTLLSWVVAYILGLYTDEIRRNITKH